jgi:hypothetical protein
MERIKQLVEEFESKWHEKLGKYDDQAKCDFYQFLKYEKHITENLHTLVQQGLTFDKTNYPWEKLVK